MDLRRPGNLRLVLTSAGLAGATAHSVAKREHEIGIRMALGAQKRDVIGLFMKGRSWWSRAKAGVTATVADAVWRTRLTAGRANFYDSPSCLS